MSDPNRSGRWACGICRNPGERIARGIKTGRASRLYLGVRNSPATSDGPAPGKAFRNFRFALKNCVGLGNVGRRRRSARGASRQSRPDR